MRYYTIKDVAERLSLNEQTLRNWISEKKVKAVKIFGATRISEEEINNMIQEVS